MLHSRGYARKHLKGLAVIPLRSIPVEKMREVNGETGAYTYVADDETAVDESLRPYSWYKEFVVKGARQHPLPDEYTAQLESVDADADPDAERESLNRERLLGESRD